ncbi:MAG: DUF2244 domain-containing protein [Steroidobacteraceae bacterium]
MPAAETLILRPNCALTPRSAGLFYAGVCGTALAVALPFVLRGLWPILPFAGLELLLLGWALRASLARREHSQSIVVSDGTVEIDSQLPGEREHVVFSRHWAHVTLRRAVSPWHPSRLVIESHGRACEVGRFLTEEERRGVAGRLQRLVGHVNESPPLFEAANS